MRCVEPTVLVAAIVVGTACNRGSGEHQPSAPSQEAAAVETPRRSEPTESSTTAHEPLAPPDLTWDGPIGWEPRKVFPPGVTHLERKEGVDYLNLEYFAWDDPELNATMLGLLRNFETTAILVPHERLCEPAWIEAIERAAPPRLLLRITKGDPTPEQWDCLQALGRFDLYLGLCHATDPAFWGCDGDIQLEALDQRPALRERVRGLGVAFSKPERWSMLPKFPRLSHLTVRGPALRQGPSATVQAELCALPDLFVVDLFDAQEPGSTPQLPISCALGLFSYSAWYLPRDPLWDTPVTPLPADVQCRLRHALFWSLDEAGTMALARCSELDLELVRP